MTKRHAACAAEGCQRNAHHDAHGRRGFCSLHYMRHKTHGDPHVRSRTPRPAADWLRAHRDHSDDECLTWPFHVGRDGYGRVHRPGSGSLTTASRLMCEIAHGEPPSARHEAAHSCGRGNHACVNPRHLYWATPSENQCERADHGTSNRGTRQWQAKLTEDDVREIRRRLGFESQTAIARDFGVNQSTVSDIKTGKKWGWLD